MQQPELGLGRLETQKLEAQKLDCRAERGGALIGHGRPRVAASAQGVFAGAGALIFSKTGSSTKVA